MPRLVGERLPKYRKHASGQAVIKISGRDFYLGPHGSKASRQEYDRAVAEWIANGRCLLGSASAPDLTINEIALRYLKFAGGYYRKNGKPTGSMASIKVALRHLCREYGRTLARDFGPLALAAIRNKMIQADMSRGYINSNIDLIRRAFKWAVSLELVPVAVHQSLATLAGLRRDRSVARETAPVLPVSDSVIEATLPHLRPTVGDMLRLQRLCGCRPDELCMIRPSDVDTSGDVWRYVPESHKTQHHGRERVIFLGPQAQQILKPYLERPADSYCFSPAEAEEAHNSQRRQNRASPMTPSQAARRPKRRPKRKPGERYTTNTYRRAIHRACDFVDEAAHREAPEIPAATRIFPRWSPNRLRHSAGTEIRRRFGLEAAQVTLGHASAAVTQIYAERDLQKAAEVMAAVG
jgi:integrase